MDSKICFIGHLTIDEIEYVDGITRCSPGGTVYYSSLTSSQLGSISQVCSVIGRDYPEDYLRILSETGVGTAKIVKHSEYKTTRYRIVYRDGDREMFLLERAPKIVIGEIEDVDAVYLGPVACEIAIEDIDRMSREFKTMLDPQGVLRTVNQDKRIILERRIDLDQLKNIWILRLSSEEAGILTGEVESSRAVEKILKVGIENVILSMGSRGVITANNKKKYFIPSYSKAKLVDSTGAGDVLGGAFLAEFLSSRDFLWASCVGASAASISIEDYGVKPVLFKEFKNNVIKRAYEIMEETREI